MKQLRYHRGTEHSREVVEFDITRRGRYITTCVVDVDLLICGLKAFPCGNGDDEKLTPAQRVELLEFAQAERKAIRDSYPVKTRKSWHDSGLNYFEEFCEPGDEVDEEMVDYFVNSVPPVLTLSFCTQAGEPHSDEKDGDNGYRPTFTTFHRIGPDRWKFDGYCFYKENVNRATGPSRLERALAEARREAEEKGGATT